MKLKKKFTSAQSQVIVIYFLRCLFKQKKNRHPVSKAY